MFLSETVLEEANADPKKMKERRNNQITDKYIKAEIEKWLNFFSSVSYFFIRLYTSFNAKSFGTLQLSKSDHMIFFIYLCKNVLQT